MLKGSPTVAKTKTSLLSTSMLFGLAGVAAVVGGGPASAQAQPQPGAAILGQSAQEATQVGDVVITGSRIRRDPTNAPTPLIQVTREQVLTTGQSTLIDYLATIPALANSQVPTDTVGSLGIGGLALPNLRSLGAGRTLTLVDGRRHVGSNPGSLAVDVDTIPRLLIENISIVTGGASSIYGADAVSGVLNFELRKDFEGLEIDANYGMLNQDGQSARRLSVLAGTNLLDDRLNVYAHGEYEKQDAVYYRNVDWLQDAWSLVGNDADPASASNDGIYDNLLWRDVRSLGTVNWGVVTLANAQPSSPQNDPDVPVPNPNCTAATANPQIVDNCFPVDPGKTYVFEGASARLANFGARVQSTGYSRTLNVGGDGVNVNTRFNVDVLFPQSESQRYQTGFNFRLLDNVNLFGEAKYVKEDTYFTSGANFMTAYISNLYTENDTAPILSNRAATPRLFTTRLDNAFLPANLRTAIANNTITNYTAPTATQPGQLNPATTRAAPYARYVAWTSDRDQENTRELQRYVIGLRGNFDRLAFLNDVSWEVAGTYGRVDVLEREGTDDGERFSYAMDAVVDTAGVLGSPGAIVCRAQLLTANGGTVTDRNTGGQIGASDPDIAQCVPLNIFGEGNQSQAALDYVRANITYTEEQAQTNVTGFVSGDLWDFWGAGAISLALGGEYRKEETQGIGRSASTAGRWLQGNTGADFALASYETKEVFGELSLPLFRDSWLGDYAELSGSYRYSDYSTVGAQEVYGVNLVYRPDRQVAIRSSFNSSIRVPSLGENFAPRTLTFLNNLSDPCDARVINNLADRTVANQRIANCTALATQLGLGGVFNFADINAANAYTFDGRAISGFNGGNPSLVPEESESFTISTILRPDFIPNFSLVLDYYEIQIDNVIASISAATAASQCVSGTSLNTNACNTLTRSPIDNPATAPDDRFAITSFIQGSINYAKRTVRGLDFTAAYNVDSVNIMGRDVGRLSYRLNGSWLIEQKQFNDSLNPGNFTGLDSSLTYPRVRFTSALTYAPTNTLNLTWAMDWQTAQDINTTRAVVGAIDNRQFSYHTTGDFARHDFTVRAKLRDDLSLRFGVVNAFDAEQAPQLGGTVYPNFDPFGRRFFIGLNFRPF